LRLYIHYRISLGNWLDIGGEVDSGKVEVFDSTTIMLFKKVLKGAALILYRERRRVAPRYLPK